MKEVLLEFSQVYPKRRVSFKEYRAILNPSLTSPKKVPARTLQAQTAREEREKELREEEEAVEEEVQNEIDSLEEEANELLSEVLLYNLLILIRIHLTDRTFSDRAIDISRMEKNLKMETKKKSNFFPRLRTELERKLWLSQWKKKGLIATRRQTRIHQLFATTYAFVSTP